MFHDRPLIDALIRAFESEGRAEASSGVRGLVSEAVNPLGTRGWRLSDASADQLGRQMLGAAGAVFRVGDRAALGPARARQTILIHVTTKCVVSAELWMPFATMPCGAWPVYGPGSSRIDLVPDERLGAADLVGPNDFGVLVVHARDGDFPAWITFGP